MREVTVLKNITKDQEVTLRFGGYEKSVKPQAEIEIPSEFAKMLLSHYPNHLIIIEPKAEKPQEEAVKEEAPAEETKESEKGPGKAKAKGKK
jgi:hypothetical protein